MKKVSVLLILFVFASGLFYYYYFEKPKALMKENPLYCRTKLDCIPQKSCYSCLYTLTNKYHYKSQECDPNSPMTDLYCHETEIRCIDHTCKKIPKE